MSNTLSLNDKETFVINDIEMGLYPSNVMCFDDNYVYDQSFLRSNSVYCYRSKYSETKVVLNFPFQIGNSRDSDAVNTATQCIRLAVELNSYPYCFIQSSRLKSYVAPTIVSSTGYMMFAVQEIALVQSAAASNVVFLEVTLKYFNFANVASDFNFVSNRVITSVTSVNENNTKNDNVLYGVAPAIVPNLATSSVWIDYIRPKVDRVMNRLETMGMLDSFASTENAVTTAGLDVKMYVPNFYGNGAKSQELLDADDGTLIGPDSKVVYTTDIDKLDSDNLPDMVATYFNQQFKDPAEENEDDMDFDLGNSVETEDKSVKELKAKVARVELEAKLYGTDYSKYSDQRTVKTKEEADKILQENSKYTKDNEVYIPGYKQTLVAYAPVSLSQFGIAIQKVEVRKQNILASHRIGGYKHPFIQYMGKMPGRTVIDFTVGTEGVYEVDVGVSALINNIMNILDRNRREQPAAEIYNHIKLVTLSNVILGVNSVVPNQSMTSASSDKQGVDISVSTFMETDTEEFVKQFQVNASGAKSMTKAFNSVVEIVLTWLNEFTNLTKTNKLSSIGEIGSESFNSSLAIIKSLITAAKTGAIDLGYQSTLEYSSLEDAEILVSRYFTSGADTKQIPLKFISNNAVSGLRLYKNRLVKGVVAFSSEAGTILSDADESTDPYVIEQSIISKLNVTASDVEVSVGSYAKWLSSYLYQIIKAWKDLKLTGSSSLKNVTFRPGNQFGLFIQNASKLIVGDTTSLMSKSLSDEQKNFVDNFYDLYVGSLYGQTIEDLHLEDLVEDYDISTDLEVQSTDPFFFLNTKEVLGTEMIEFYNASYDLGDLDPSLPTTALEDGKNSQELVTDQTASLLDIKYLTLEEVDYNFQAAPASESISSTIIDAKYRGKVNPAYAKKGNITSEAAKAIENALIKYGFASNEEFREYMYKTAAIESDGGSNMNIGKKGVAKGLFQFYPGAISGIIRRNNKVFASQGYVKLNPTTADNVAKRIYEDVNFAGNLQLNADLFIEYTLINGGIIRNKSTGKLDSVAMYVQHNQGAGGAKYLLRYLSSGKEQDLPSDIRKNYLNNAAKSPNVLGSYYEHFTDLYASINLRVNGKELSTVYKGVPKGAEALSGSAITKQANAETRQITPYRIEVIPTGTILKAKVVSITDGDTLIASHTSLTGSATQNSIRISGIDTEETFEYVDKEKTIKNTKYDAATVDWGLKAKARLTSLTPVGSSITVKVVDNDAKGGVRLVGEVTTISGKDVAEVILSEGLAVYRTEMGTSQKYANAMTTAQRARVGMWSKLSVEDYERTVTTKTTKTAVESGVLEGATNKKIARTNVYQPFADGKIRRVSSDFSFTSLRGSSHHRGIDIAVPVGTTVVAAASGRAIVEFQAGKAGLYVKINHGNGFETLYMHLTKALIKNGEKVSYNQPIGLSGGDPSNPNSGRSSGPHLHYEVRYKGIAIHPYSTKKALSAYAGDAEGSLGTGGSEVAYQTTDNNFYTLEYNPRSNITEANTVFNEDALAQTILDNARKDMNIGFKAAMPSLKAYIVIGNENDGLNLDTITSGPQYYEVKGIQSFQLFCNNDSTPVDTAVMRIVDPSFASTDLWTSLMRIPKINYDNFGTDYETQFKANRAILQPGTKLSIRMGYGNNPNNLNIVFNGGITELESGPNQTLTLILEGYGRELLAELKSTEEPTKLENAPHSPTSHVIGYGLVSKPIDHFGYMASHLKWLYKTDTDPEQRNLVDALGTEHSYFFTTSAAIHRSRMYMNCFAPEIEKADDSFANYWSSFFSSLGLSNRMFGYPFFVYMMTPWDMCKQMEYRHPGTIFKPMIYQDHMTPFYGVKEQMYIAKDLKGVTQSRATTAIDEQQYTSQDIKSYYDRRRERMEPVSNIHLVTSSSNLISNTMSLNNQWKTTTNVSYFNDNGDFEDQYDWSSTKMTIDDNLLPWEIREKELRLSGCHGKYSSFVYGTTDLKKEAETMYGGKIVFLGNARVKAGDYIFLDDTENRISGLLLVRECIHHFDANNGFVTEITPGMYVEPSMFMYSPLWLKLMCALKVGASKSRLMLSTNYTSEFAFVQEFVRLSEQLEASGASDQTSDYAQYLGYMTLASALAWSLGNKTRAGYFPGSSFWTFGSTAFKTAFSTSTEAKLASARMAKINAGAWMTSFRADATAVKDWTKTKVLGSQTFQTTAGKISKNRFVRGLRYVHFKRWFPAGGMARSLGSSALSGTIRAATGLFHAAATANPLLLLIDVVLSLVVSWGFAKIEESQYTRQPLLMFPILRHGKPYVAGMAGFTRNSVWDSKVQEWNKTMKAVSKTAALHEANIKSKGGQPSMILTVLAGPAKESQIKTNAWISSRNTKNVETKDEAIIKEKTSDVVNTSVSSLAPVIKNPFFESNFVDLKTTISNAVPKEFKPYTEKEIK